MKSKMDSRYNPSALRDPTISDDAIGKAFRKFSSEIDDQDIVEEILFQASILQANEKAKSS